jgi:hypothetical protein
MYLSIDKQCRPVATVAFLLATIVAVISGIAVILLGALNGIATVRNAGILYTLTAPVFMWMVVYIAYIFSALMGLKAK